jgi:gliding motility-associated-like protein
MVGEGNEFLFQGFATDTLYVTQTIDGCESEPHQIMVKISNSNIQDILWPNVITPNGDDLNDHFELPLIPEDCFGSFLSISIYNRYGKEVFASKTRNFLWRPENLPSGVYYYSIHLSKRKFQGNISIIY